MTQDYTLETMHKLIGQEIGVSNWVDIDQDRINAFAECTGDHQWIHVDQERAKASLLGTTIAHGYLTLALLPMMTEEIGVIPAGVQHVLNYGADRIRFITPVPEGSRVRDRVRLLDVTESNGRYLIKMENRVEIEGVDRPAMIADTLMLAFPAQ